MPAGRPATTGESPIARFRARGPLADRLEARRAYPDVRNEPVYGGPVPKDGELPQIGTVAARDLAVFYDLLNTELAAAAAELHRSQVVMILDAVWSLLPTAHWITNASELLAAEVEDAYGDDEDGPDWHRSNLASTIRSWPRLRAYAVLEACLAVRDAHAGDDLDTALAKAGLLPKGAQR
ncbi:hypothetical protein [Actinacidiphila acididurans]|uniref:Tail assembly chaperone n=1 Tax=Actinacidiphila acididurans TaxID=2784346 RepID=A0ABS2U370_9ACTN|nr:hypothetical protein [Actinacidiphila acididurans]MBM9510059.1 hypothetical protein [Actinacidiphila acididurans]